MRLPIFNRHPRAELSAYLDGELIPLRIEAMQVHLASCHLCRTELAALRQLQADLAALPEMPAPRSFALTPQMAARPAPERPRAYVPPRAAALANGMRLAGAAMTVALALVLVLDFTGSGTTSNSADNALTAAEGRVISTADESDQSFDSNSGPAPAADTGANFSRLTPTPTSVPVYAPGSTVGSNEPTSGENLGSGISAYDSSSPGAAAASTGTPPPNAGLTNGTPSVPKSLDADATESQATGDAQSLNVPAFPASGAATSGGGVDTLLIVALALAAGVALTVAGSFLLPRIGREEL